jgi:NADPH-dependent 2,4-dienoyl-CoA reductase/sulfur reductase-like enzyme
MVNDEDDEKLKRFYDYLLYKKGVTPFEALLLYRKIEYKRLEHFVFLFKDIKIALIVAGMLIDKGAIQFQKGSKVYKITDKFVDVILESGCEMSLLCCRENGENEYFEALVDLVNFGKENDSLVFWQEVENRIEYKMAELSVL